LLAFHSKNASEQQAEMRETLLSFQPNRMTVKHVERMVPATAEVFGVFATNARDLSRFLENLSVDVQALLSEAAGSRPIRLELPET